MRIGIFGGSFNPPHKMHFDIANYLAQNNYVDKVIFVPTGFRYSYKNNMEDAIHRYNMVSKMIDGINYFDVSDYELKDYEVHTFDTLNYFKNLYVNDEIFFICGADNLSYIGSWYQGDKILSDYKIIVVNRNGYDLNNIFIKYNNYNNIIVANIDLNLISSTMIRENLINGLDVSKNLDTKVLRYIKSNRLYEVVNK